jgi:hypothetical protein
MTYLLPADLRDALLKYLSERPYQEVVEGISALVALEPAPEPQPEETPCPTSTESAQSAPS